ncbi:MAG TPA: hypothetical protein VMZ29_17355 [Candidatus Bathyarchaeia archaeon]|nr:hypothetical protein [Candidatus Bathyarchaeia archaeon]
MRNRIEILKEIMELEKQYALEEIDSEIFENRMLLLERHLHETTALTEDEFKKAVIAKEIPLSADRLVGKISIEDLLPTFNVPRTFYRHLKIKREIKELERNIMDLQHNIQKMKILLAEKKVNPDAAAVKIETLDFDLRLADNRYGARDKYLKRNPSKGDLLRFTLENYLKFSFGHGVSNEEELLKISRELQLEIKLRCEYRKALAEMLATMKTSQLDISTSKGKNGLPDFKALREFQQTINELKDYIDILYDEVKVYSNCISRLGKDTLEMDDSHELFIPPEEFGIDIEGEEKIIFKDIHIPKSELGPLLESLNTTTKLDDPIGLFLIDTTDSSLSIEPFESEEIEELNATFVIPEAPLPLYVPDLGVEIVGGMEDFNTQFEIKDSDGKMNEMTKQIIFKGFEGILEKLIDKEINGTTPKIKPSPPKAKIIPLSSEIKKTPQKESSNYLDNLTDELVIADDIPHSQTIEEQELSQEYMQDKLLPPPPPPPPLPAHSIPPPPKEETMIPPIPKMEIAEKEITTPQTQQKEIQPLEILTDELIISVDEPASIEEEDKVEEVSSPQVVTQSLPPPSSQTESQDKDLLTPQKTSMVSEKLFEAATEAWKLAGKEIFNIIDDSRRDFLGYIQEVVVFEKNRLGFILVSEEIADQTVIDKIFDQIKPLWVTEDLLESAEKRKDYVIREAMEALQIQRDVVLHVSKLQEFANFRNVNYPEDTSSSAPDIIGIVPVDKIRLKRGSIICLPENIVRNVPYRTAPWDGELITEEKDILKRECYSNKGQYIGKILTTIKHPLLGKLFLVDTEVPNKSLIDYLVSRLDIVEQKQKERLWLVKYLIAKQLRIPEGDALKPKTLINYSLRRGFPILPNEILNSYRIFISGGSIEKISKNRIILKNSSRVFYPSEILPMDCLRVREMNGRHLGTCLGISLSENPVLLVSEKLSREIVILFTDATLEKDVMNDISQSVIGTIGVDFKDSLCTHNIIKSLIIGKKIQTLGDYGKYLTKMNITGLNISDIQIVEKGTIYMKSVDRPTASNIFND